MNGGFAADRCFRTALAIIVYGTLLIVIQRDYLPRTDDQAISAAAFAIFP
jgi:hypothetical protein